MHSTTNAVMVTTARRFQRCNRGGSTAYKQLGKCITLLVLTVLASVAVGKTVVPDRVLFWFIAVNRSVKGQLVRDSVFTDGCEHDKEIFRKIENVVSHALIIKNLKSCSALEKTKDQSCK